MGSNVLSVLDFSSIPPEDLSDFASLPWYTMISYVSYIPARLLRQWSLLCHGTDRHILDIKVSNPT